MLHGYLVLSLVVQFVNESCQAKWIYNAIEMNDLNFLRILTFANRPSSARVEKYLGFA